MDDAAPALRVLVCTQGFPRGEDDHHAGFVAAHAEAVHAAGAEVTVLCPSAPDLAPYAHLRGVDVVRFRYAPRRFETLAYTGAMHRRARGWAALLLVPFLVGFLVEAVRRARDADVLHAHWWLPSGVVAVVAGRLTGVPVVVTVHGTDAAMARGPLRLLARWVLRRADAVEAVSADLARWCERIAGVDARAWHRCRCRPRTRRADAGRRRRARSWPWAASCRRRASTSSWRPWPAPVTCSSSSATATSAPRWSTSPASVGADVRFLGSLPPAALPERYAAARVVAVPSRREGFGMVAAEAAAAGRAVVAADVGGLPDLVDDTNGVLVPPDDVDALADGLRGIDPALGRGGPPKVAHLAADRVGAAALDAYRHMIPSGRRPLLRPLVRWTAGLLALVALVLAGRSLADALADARSLHLDWSAGPVLRSLAAAIGAGLVLSLSWVGLVRTRDPAVGWRSGVGIWWLGQLGRYLPTGLGSLPARVGLARRAGFAARPALWATAIETAALPLACLILWLATVVPPFGPIAALVVAAGGVVALHAAGVRWGQAVAYATMVTGQVALRAVGLGALFALAGASTPALGDLVGAVGGAYLLGLLAVFAPGGVGVREVVLANALAPSAGATAATAAAVGWRLVELLAEFVLLAATWGTRGRLRASNSKGPGNT